MEKMYFENIPAWNVEAVLKKGKNLAKYGVSTNIADIYTVKREASEFECATIEITFPNSLIEGSWEFLGVKVSLDNENFLTFGNVPKTFVNNSFYCDSCHSDRFRKSVIIIRNNDNGEVLQVGKSCIKKYLGNVYSVFSSLLYDLDTILESSQEENYDDIRRISNNYVNVHKFLYIAYEDIMKRGYHKRDYYSDIEPTASSAWDLYLDYKKEITEENEKVVTDCIKAYTDFVEKKGEDDFSRNVLTLLSQSYIDIKYTNMIVFVPTFFINQQKYEAERKAKEEKRKEINSNLNNEYLGNVKDKVNCIVRLIHCHRYETNFTYSGELNYMYTFITNNGELVQWKTQNYIPFYLEGEYNSVSLEKLINDKVEFTIKGSIKECKEFKGRYYTVLTRCKVSN